MRCEVRRSGDGPGSRSVNRVDVRPWGGYAALGAVCLLFGACGHPEPPAAQPDPGCGAPAPAESAAANAEEPAREEAAPPAGLSLRLNLPSFQLQVLDRGTTAATYPVAVGQAEYPTPVGEFQVERIVWNPWWVPPRAPWAAGDTITPPGPANPMGRVKLLFRRPDYYLHGTADTTSLGKPASHGCVRLSNTDALALAGLVWRRGNRTDSVPSAPLPSSGEVRVTDLPQRVPLEIRYDVALVGHDSLMVYPDIYHHYGPALEDLLYRLLADAGVGPDVVDSASVRLLLREGTLRASGAALGSLRRPGR